MARLTDVVAPPPFSQTARAGSAVRHTTGPWTIQRRSPGNIRWDSIIRGANGEPIASSLAAGYSEHEAEANASLIAAAPELLAALEQSEIAVAELCQDQNPANQCWVILAQVRAAIAKAKAGA